MPVTQGKLQRALNRVVTGQVSGTFAPASHTHDERYAPLTPPHYTSATKPAASSAWDGEWILVKDAALPTTVEVCVQNSAGGYEWLIVAQSS